MPAKLLIKNSGKLRTFLNIQNLEKFTTGTLSFLEDLLTIYPTDQ